MNDKCSMVESFISASLSDIIAVYESTGVMITEQYTVDNIRFVDNHLVMGSLSSGNVISICLDNVTIREISAEDSEYSDDEELLVVADDWRVTLAYG